MGAKSKLDVWCIYPPVTAPKATLDQANMVMRRHRANDGVFRDMKDGVLLVRAPKGYLTESDLAELGRLVPLILRILRAETGGEL